ncbi:hypothetical protein M5K25_024643 [Dendrobium thyrsiflorum]|uniref:Uncharacterized protein n=1 Tax=Dendrobium thyrsiflorum TaxID=117978 RepID=A0ABD0U2G2_DENTH
MTKLARGADLSRRRSFEISAGGRKSKQTEDSARRSGEEVAFRGKSTRVFAWGCKTCGREEIEKRCNGEGRIQGGIATIRGFGWWPIKAFKPCPGFVASGGRYRRHGQSLDEVAFGRIERDISVKLKAKST